MQLLLGFCLLFFLNFAEVAAASLDILIKQQKFAVPYMPYRARRQQSELPRGAGERVSQDAKFVELGKDISVKIRSFALLETSLHSNHSLDRTTCWHTLSSAQNNNDKKIVIRYSSELKERIDHFSKPQSKQLNSAILLSAFDQSKNKKEISVKKMPFSDAIAQFNYKPVLESTYRKDHPKTVQYLYRQLAGANHDYVYCRDTLIGNPYGGIKKTENNQPEKKPLIGLEQQNRLLH